MVNMESFDLANSHGDESDLKVYFDEKLYQEYT